MELFLVCGKIRRQEYMGDEKIVDDMRIIKAETFEEACEKYTKYWDDRTSQYSHYYTILSADVTETIV